MDHESPFEAFPVHLHGRRTLLILHLLLPDLPDLHAAGQCGSRTYLLHVQLSLRAGCCLPSLMDHTPSSSDPYRDRYCHK